MIKINRNFITKLGEKRRRNVVGRGRMSININSSFMIMTFSTEIMMFLKAILLDANKTRAFLCPKKSKYPSQSEKRKEILTRAPIHPSLTSNRNHDLGEGCDALLSGIISIAFSLNWVVSRSFYHVYGNCLYFATCFLYEWRKRWHLETELS